MNDTFARLDAMSAPTRAALAILHCLSKTSRRLTPIKYMTMRKS
jgi:hypothetical protein